MVAAKMPRAKMPGANVSGSSHSPTPGDDLALLRSQQPKKVAPARNTTRPLTCSNGRGTSYQKMSNIETIIPRIRARNSMLAILADTATQYHYLRTTCLGRKSENCCSNCGNPAPSILGVFRNRLISKDLDLFQNGPRLANRMLPA
jgi:hypothetical protein